MKVGKATYFGGLMSEKHGKAVLSGYLGTLASSLSTLRYIIGTLSEDWDTRYREFRPDVEEMIGVLNEAD